MNILSSLLMVLVKKLLLTKKIIIRNAKHVVILKREQKQVVHSREVSLSKEVYSKITTGNANWNKLSAPEATLYPWDLSICGAHALLYLGDSVTTDHIFPAGSIPRTSPAARFLAS